MFPEPVYGPWRPRIEAAAQRLHRVDPVDLVVATGNPYVDFMVAQRLNVDHGVPFVLDDRDSWVVDVYTGEPFAGSDRTQQWLGWMLGRCTQAWYVNPPIAGWHRERYPAHADRIQVVENGWDPRFLEPATVRHAAGERLIVGYIGTISESFPLGLLIDGWRCARELSPRLAEAELRFFGQLGHGGGGLSGHAAKMAAAGPDGVVHMGRWPKARIAQAYSDIDVLLFAKEGSGMVTSGKVYEYVATGLPVVSSIEAEHDSRRVLSGYPRWHPSAHQDAGSLGLALAAAAEDSVRHDDTVVEQAIAYGEQFRRDRILLPVLRELVEALVPL
jgi:glycosyltransferase involved in cell wall biosynthesis